MFEAGKATIQCRILLVNGPLTNWISLIRGIDSTGGKNKMAFAVLFDDDAPEWATFLARVRRVREARDGITDLDLLTIVAREMGVPLAGGYLSEDASRAVSSLLATNSSDHRCSFQGMHPSTHEALEPPLAG